MAKYRKKPVVVEAELYVKGMEDGFVDVIDNDEKVTKPYIDTLEGKMIITDGDYIITGIVGERYPCKPDIFNETYEKI